MHNQAIFKSDTKGGFGPASIDNITLSEPAASLIQPIGKEDKNSTKEAYQNENPHWVRPDHSILDHDSDAAVDKIDPDDNCSFLSFMAPFLRPRSIHVAEGAVIASSSGVKQNEIEENRGQSIQSYS